MNADDIVLMEAAVLSRAIYSRQVSCVEVMNAYLDMRAHRCLWKVMAARFNDGWKVPSRASELPGVRTSRRMLPAKRALAYAYENALSSTNHRLPTLLGRT